MHRTRESIVNINNVSTDIVQTERGYHRNQGRFDLPVYGYVTAVIKIINVHFEKTTSIMCYLHKLLPTRLREITRIRMPVALLSFTHNIIFSPATILYIITQYLKNKLKIIAVIA